MDTILIILSILLFFSIMGSLASDKLGVPSLVLFLIIGVLAGPEGFIKIKLTSPEIAQQIGVIALSFIIFSGGFGTQFRIIKPILLPGILLSSAGVIISCLVMGLFLHYILGFSLLTGFLIGAIVSSTDAASVFSVLNSKNVLLKGGLKPILEFESASNDPMSVSLTLAFIMLINKPGTDMPGMIIFMLKQFLIGGAAGILISMISVYLLKRFIKLDYEGVYSVLTIGLVLFTYGIVNTLGGSPFLAVYILGLYLGNSDILYKRNLLRYHDNISWLSQIVMFLCLGLLIYPSQIIPASFKGVLATVFLILIARPASVFISLAFTRKFKFREKLLLSWVGLRGAAPIILSTFPLLAGIPEANSLFYIVFFIVITSVLLQGTSIPFLAKILKLYDRGKSNIKYPIEFDKSDKIEGELNEIEIPENSIVVNTAVRDLGLPENVMVILIYRNGRFFPVNGKTILYPKDRLLVLATISEFIKFTMQVLLEKENPEEAKNSEA